MKTRATFYLKSLLCVLFFSLMKPVSAQTIVQIGDKYGLLSKENRMYSPEAYDQIYTVQLHSKETYYIFVNDGKKQAIKRSELDKLSPNDWETLRFPYDTIYDAKSSNSAVTLIVGKGNHYGALDRTGKISLPLVYDHIITNNYNTFTILEKNGKLAALHRKADPVISTSLPYIYDEITTDYRSSITHFRIGKKYGFYYGSGDGNHVIDHLSEVIYDEPITTVSLFLSTVKDDVLIYFFDPRKLMLDGHFIPSLPLREKTLLINLSDLQEMKVTGNNRLEKIVLAYPRLYIDSPDSTMHCYNLETATDESQVSTPMVSYALLMVTVSDGPSYSAKDMNVYYLKRREQLDEDYFQEQILAAGSMKEVASFKLKKDKTLQLEAYFENYAYISIMAISIDQRDIPKHDDVKAYIYWPQSLYQEQKPQHEDGNFAERWKKNHSGGGGSMRSDGWRGIFWIGGR